MKQINVYCTGVNTPKGKRKAVKFNFLVKSNVTLETDNELISLAKETLNKMSKVENAKLTFHKSDNTSEIIMVSLYPEKTLLIEVSK